MSQYFELEAIVIIEFCVQQHHKQVKMYAQHTLNSYYKRFRKVIFRYQKHDCKGLLSLSFRQVRLEKIPATIKLRRLRLFRNYVPRSKGEQSDLQEPVPP